MGTANRENFEQSYILPSPRLDFRMFQIHAIVVIRSAFYTQEICNIVSNLENFETYRPYP